jgi:hypothetical protein
VHRCLRVNERRARGGVGDRIAQSRLVLLLHAYRVTAAA